MASAADATIADLEAKLAKASEDLSKVKRTASIVGALVAGGGIVWLVWRLFSAHQAEVTNNGP